MGLIPCYSSTATSTFGDVSARPATKHPTERQSRKTSPFSRCYDSSELAQVSLLTKNVVRRTECTLITGACMEEGNAVNQRMHCCQLIIRIASKRGRCETRRNTSVTVTRAASPISRSTRTHTTRPTVCRYNQPDASQLKAVAMPQPRSSSSKNS
jgi:hypothetical protein